MSQTLTANIVEQTIGSDTDKRLQIAGGHYVRKLKEGSDWTRLRVGMMVSNCRESSWSAAPYYYIGLMSGTVNPPGSATPAHFYGACSAGGWQYNNATNRTISNAAYTTNRVFVCEGGVGSLKTATSADYLYTLSPNSGSAPIFFDIEKGSPNWTISMYGCDYSSVAGSTLEKFSDTMPSDPFLTSGGPFGFMKKATFHSYPVDESTYGVLDTFCFAWLGENVYDTEGNLIQNNAFEISDIAVKRLA